MYTSRWSVFTTTHKYLEKNWCGFKKYEHLHTYCHYILIVGGTFFSLPITALTVVVHPLYLLKHDVIYSNVLLHNIYTLLHCVCSYFVASFYVKSIHRNDFSKKMNLFCTTSRGWLSTKTMIFTCIYLSITRFFFSGILLFFKSKRIL